MFMLSLLTLNTFFNKVVLNKILSSLQFQCKKVLVYSLIFTQLYSPAAYGGKLYFEIDKEETTHSNKRVINLKIWEGDSIKLLPGSESLNQLKETELGIFCQGDQLFCKAYGKESILVDDPAAPSIHSEHFDRIRKTIQKGEQTPSLSFDPLTEEDEAEFRKFTSLIGYTKENSIYKNKVEYTVRNNISTDCRLPNLKPKVPFHTPVELEEAFDSNRHPILRISHSDPYHKEGLDFTVDHWGNIEFHSLTSPRRFISVKTFGDIHVKPIADYKVKILPTGPQPLVPKIPYAGMAIKSAFERPPLRAVKTSLSLEPRELGLYLKNDALYCKIKDREEIQLVGKKGEQTNPAVASLRLKSKLLKRLKDAVKTKFAPSSEDKEAREAKERQMAIDSKALLELAELSGYIPTAFNAKSLHLTGKNIFCEASITADDTLNLTAVQKLHNKSWLFSNSIHLAGDIVNNENKIISSNVLTVDVRTLFNNAQNAQVSATNSCLFKGKGRLHNHKEAEIESSGTFVSSLPEVDNEGSIIADRSISFEALLNKLTNSGGIFSHGSLGIYALGKVTNLGFLQGRYGKTVITAQRLRNNGSIASLNGPLFLKVETGKNRNSITSRNQGGVHLTIGKLFTNFKEIESDDFIAINGSGYLHNRKSGHINTPQHLRIDDVSVINDGMMEACKKLLAVIPLLVQRGILMAREASLNIKDLQNSGKILIEEVLNLIVGNGSNEGHIQGNSFTFTVLNQFINRQAFYENKPILHGGKFFILEGDGSFINQHIVRAEDLLVLKNKMFRNEDHVEAGGNLEIGGDITLTNAQKAKILSMGALKSIGAASLKNHKGGLVFSEGNMTLDHLLSFRNRGAFDSKGLLRLISSGDLDNRHKLLGALGMYLEAAGVMSNTGGVESEETIGIHAAQIVNHKKIQGTKGVTLKASQSFENKEGAEVNSAKGKVTLTSPQFTIQGPVKGQNVDVHHQGATPFQGNVAAIDTLTLHVPYGWSLENKAQAFGHSIVLHGPIRHPGNLNIKKDFTWYNSEALSNNFDIVVGGKINFNIPGSWCNLKLVEAQKGSTVTTPHFSNSKEGVFNSCESTSFTCANGFDNYGFFRMHGGGTIHTPAGSITNHPGADFEQLGHDKVLIYNAAQKVSNIGGRVYIEGILNSTSTIFSNESVYNKTSTTQQRCYFFYRGYLRKYPQVRPTTLEGPGDGIQLANFCANQAHINANELHNSAAHLSAQKIFQFNGNKLLNYTPHYTETGRALVIRGKIHHYYYAPSVEGTQGSNQRVRLQDLTPYPYTRPKNAHERRAAREARIAAGIQAYTPHCWDVPTHKITVGSKYIAKLYSQQAMKININGMTYEASTLNNSNTIPGVNNTGSICSDDLSLDLGSSLPTHIDFSEVNGKITEITQDVRILPYYEEMLAGPRFWTLDDERNTPYKIISRLYTPLPSAEETEAQRQGANEARQAIEADLPAFKEWMRRLLIEQFNKEWAGRANPQQTRETALAQYLEEHSDLCFNWEPTTEELAPTNPESFAHLSSRIAVVAHENYRGGERLLSDLSLLANQVIKVMMTQFGVPTLSRNIYNPLLYTRILEDEGYLNARRVHGLPPLPTPENWCRLSPQEQLQTQLREIIALPEIEHFKDPAIIYELVNFHGENVLSAMMTFPKNIRKAFKFLMGRRFFANYFAMQARGDVTIRNLDPRNGARIESTEGSVEVENAFSQGTFDFIAALDLRLLESIEGDSIHGTGGRFVKIIGTNVKAKTDIGLKAGVHLEVIAKEIRSLSKSGSKKNSRETQTVRNKLATLVAGRYIEAYSKGGLRWKGVDATAGRKIHLKSELAPEIQNVHDVVQTTHTKKTKNKWYKSGSETVRQNTTSTMLRNGFNAPKVKIEGEDSFNVEPIHSTTTERTIITSHQGDVTMKMGTSTMSSAVQKKRNYVVWQKMQNKGRVREKGELSHVTGGLTINAKKVIVETPKNISLSELAKNPRHAWLKKLQDDPKTTWRKIEMAHKRWNHTAQGLTPAGAALISLAVCIATAGPGGLFAEMGAAVGGSVTTSLGSVVAGEIAGTMAAAGLTTLTTQASISVINNRGNMGKVLQELGSKKNIRALAISMATAGLTEGFLQGLEGLQADPTALTQAAASQTGSVASQTGAALSEVGLVTSQAGSAASQATTSVSQAASFMESVENLAAQTFSLSNVTDTFQRSATSAGVTAGIATLTGDLSPGEALVQGARTAAATVFQTAVAQATGDAYSKGTMGFIEHKGAHFLGAAAAGIIFSGDPISGAIGGVAELVADALPSTLSVDTRANLGRFAAAITATVADQDVNLAIHTGTVAVTENTVRHAKSDQKDGAKGENEGDRQKTSNMDATSIPPLTPENVDILQLARENTMKDFRDIMVKLERPDGPPTPRIQEKYEYRYHKFQTVIANQNTLNPGHERFEYKSNLSPEEFKREKLVEMKASGQLTSHNRPQAERIIENEYNFFQGRKADLIIGGIITLGAGLGRNAPSYTTSFKPANISAETTSGARPPLPQAFVEERATTGSTLKLRKLPETPANPNAPKTHANQNAVNANKTEAKLPLREPKVVSQTATPARRAETNLPSQAPQPKVQKLTKIVGTPAEEASSASRLRQARAAEDQGRRLQNVVKQQKEAVPQQATQEVLPNIYGNANTTRQFKGLNALEKQQREAQKAAEKIPPGLRGKTQNSATPPRAVQPIPAPKPRAQADPMKIMRAKDGTAKLPYTQNHHIIHEKLKDHELWKLSGRNAQEHSNRMLLPTKEGAKLYQTKKTIHQGRHTDASRTRLEKQMDRARDQGKLEGWTQEQYSQKVDKIIQEEREALRSGDRILNKNHRPDATDK